MAGSRSTVLLRSMGTSALQNTKHAHTHLNCKGQRHGTFRGAHVHARYSVLTGWTRNGAILRPLQTLSAHLPSWTTQADGAVQQRPAQMLRAACATTKGGAIIRGCAIALKGGLERRVNLSIALDCSLSQALGVPPQQLQTSTPSWPLPHRCRTRVTAS